MNVLCSFLTIYALLCSNVVVHLSDHNRVMVAQVDYHMSAWLCLTDGPWDIVATFEVLQYDSSGFTL